MIERRDIYLLQQNSSIFEDKSKKEIIIEEKWKIKNKSIYRWRLYKIYHR